MTIELSADDRAAIEAIIGPRENKSLRDVLRDSLEHGVEYGIRAGLERAAKMCDTSAEAFDEWARKAKAQELLSPPTPTVTSAPFYYLLWQEAHQEAAAAIRALIKD